jgi:hypothetical protein
VGVDLYLSARIQRSSASAMQGFPHPQMHLHAMLLPGVVHGGWFETRVMHSTDGGWLKKEHAWCGGAMQWREFFFFF